MEPALAIDAIRQTIQAAVTPVFLLLGVSSLLSVMSLRLGRVIDRARSVEEKRAGTPSETQRISLESEENCLYRRIRLINWAIRLFVSAALTVCLVVVTLFVGGSLRLGTVIPIAALFILAMALLIGGLLLFLAEVTIASRQAEVPLR